MKAKALLIVFSLFMCLGMTSCIVTRHEHRPKPPKKEKPHKHAKKKPAKHYTPEHWW